MSNSTYPLLFSMVLGPPATVNVSCPECGAVPGQGCKGGTLHRSRSNDRDEIAGRLLVTDAEELTLP
jgi:hypothetical protein